VALPASALIILTGAGVYTGFAVGFSSPLLWFPVALLLFLGLIDSAPVRVTGPPAIAALALGGYYVYPLVSGLRMLFATLFVAAGIVVLLGVLHRKKRAPGLVPLVAATTASLVAIVTAGSGLEMFFAWEILTVATYLLVLRRPRGRGAALTYGAFSIGAALAILAGFALLAAGTPSGVSGLAGISLEIRSASPGTSVPTGIGTAGLLLVAVGVLVKAAAAGLHLWLPEAYGATDDEATALLSSAVSKAAVYALFLTAGLMLFGTAASAGSGLSAVSPNSPATAGLVAAVLGWIGIATALFGALLAVFQEDAKQLLAYSSMSQLGYMIVGVSLLSHLGWVSGLYLTVLHAVVKAMLFLAIAGVIARAGTSSMYRLGGLIKRMPATFVSVLMAIIAVSGVPPLAGFGGKWLLYTAMIEQGWYLQAGLAFFASAVAFLYLFRLIHTIFLGQLKDEHRSTREAPPALLIPQFLLIALLMAMSMFPNLILEPAIAAAQPYFARTIAEEGYTVISSLGYWNGNLVMYVTMGVFALPFIWLVIIMRRPQHVEQFNIVYAAERPERPETTHFAHNFFAPYRKALGFLVTPLLRRLYRALAGGTEAIASALRRIYTGNGQTYALHIVLFLVVIFFAVGGAP
jgi:formate hydrogenlyase subunit 3/multisubunit Na+/H+ antiporter MnhD subunit